LWPAPAKTRSSRGTDQTGLVAETSETDTSDERPKRVAGECVATEESARGLDQFRCERSQTSL